MKKLFNSIRLPIVILTGIAYCLLGTLMAPSYAAGLSADLSGATVAMAESASPSADGTVSTQTKQEQVEKAKAEAEATAESLLDQEAIAAVEETKAAIAAIDAGKPQDALQALERATGKLDLLLARNPELALIPVSTTINIIDVAPLDDLAIQQFRNRLKSAINAGDFPEAREILANLMSEVRTKTVNLPLATYPEAMKEAARLLDAGNLTGAKEVLQVALSTLVITEKTQPIPVINAQTNLFGASAIADMDRDDALQLLEDARQDLKLAKDLGYASGDRTYRELDRAIDDIESKLKLKADTTSAFAALQEQLSSFLKRISA